jgi:hypothetical protein
MCRACLSDEKPWSWLSVENNQQQLFSIAAVTVIATVIAGPNKR